MFIQPLWVLLRVFNVFLKMVSVKNESASNNAKKNIKPYGKVVLTLKNQLLPDEKLAVTPSQLDGLGSETETDLRIYGCELIQTAGILLKLPQVSSLILFPFFFLHSHILFCTCY